MIKSAPRYVSSSIFSSRHNHGIIIAQREDGVRGITFDVIINSQK